MLVHLTMILGSVFNIYNTYNPFDNDSKKRL